MAAAATQQRDPSRDVISAPPIAGAGCGLVLLDPRAVTSCFDAVSAAPSPTAAASVASTGRIVLVSLHLEPPPGISYVEVASGDPFIDDPTIVAADGDLLLIDMGFHESVRYEDDDSRSRISTRHVDDLFVYKADPERPLLWRLPARPSRHVGGSLRAGIVRRGGDGEFVLADLQTRVEYLEGGYWTIDLLRYSSTADRWEVKKLDMPDDEDTGGVVLRASSWVTDAAFSSGGLVYWADYHRGVLYCDVAAATDDLELRFVEFPRTNYVPWGQEDFRYGDRMYPDRHKRVSVDGGGVIWFAHVDDSRDSTGEWGSVKITTWSMRTPELGWVEEHTLDLFDDVVSPPIFGNQRVLGAAFPVVSVQEEDVVHVVLWVDLACFCWMATLDMRSRSFRSCEMLQKALKRPENVRYYGDATEKVGEAPLIWCEVGKYASP